MIKANELRKTNFVLRDGNIVEVGFNVLGFDIVPDDPILITEDILLKCGFENNGKNRKYKAIGCNLEITGTGNYIRYWLCGGKSIILTHLHQLQNLYYCLTGEELNVQL